MKYLFAILIFLAGLAAGSQLTIWQLGEFIKEDRETLGEAHQLVLESKDLRIEMLREELGKKEAGKVVNKKPARRGK